MRRRSERKKSSDVVSSPAPASRRTSRRSGKSRSISETEKVVEKPQEQNEQETQEADQYASSEERSEPNRRNKATRNRTPVSPTKRSKTQRAVTPEQKIDVIPEEENGSATNAEEEQNEVREIAEIMVEVDEKAENEGSPDKIEVTIASPALSPKRNVENKVTTLDVLEIQADVEKDKLEEVIPQSTSSRNNTLPENEQFVATPTKEKQNDIYFTPEKTAEPTKNEEKNNKQDSPKAEKMIQLEIEVPAEPKEDVKSVHTSPIKIGRTRKRKWITNKTNDSKAPILSISTDSLKNLIADVHPVPLSDVQLDSTSEVEEVLSEREEGEETPTPDRDHQQVTLDIPEKIVKRIDSEEKYIVPDHGANALPADQRSPSPARNNTSNVLFITNLVRPFTVLQLKGLLARTGKITENGFWIDRIKSKCYVQYETDDEAVETRHALHGVRWPISNPKCLCVEFGSKADMDRSIQSTQDEAPKFGQDNTKDNVIAGTGWNRERIDIEDKKNVRSARPVREWDVGKKESLERTKGRDVEKRHSRDRDTSGNRENEKNDRDGKKRPKNREQSGSRSLSPVRKLKKKENEPPLRLLDDLFRKTRAAPSIYWLPLTPEQIAEKEVIRQKRIEEHKQRIKQREEEREKEREKERNRGSDRERGRERDHRRNRSNDRRRSRSRDRRRY